MSLQTYTADCWPGMHTAALLVVHVNMAFFQDTKERLPFLVGLLSSKLGLSVSDLITVSLAVLAANRTQHTLNALSFHSNRKGCSLDLKHNNLDSLLTTFPILSDVVYSKFCCLLSSAAGLFYTCSLSPRHLPSDQVKFPKTDILDSWQLINNSKGQSVSMIYLQFSLSVFIQVLTCDYNWKRIMIFGLFCFVVFFRSMFGCFFMMMC